MKIVLLIAAALLTASPVAAQHAHGAKGPNGGLIEDVAGVHAELVTSGNTITFNIFDDATKPVSTSGFTGSALVASGADKETVTLSPAADNALKGEAKKSVPAHAPVTLMLKTKDGKSGQAKFVR